MLNWAMTAAAETTNVLTEVAGRLRTLRTERGLTLIELSKATGISKSTLSRLESGQRKPSLELLLPIARGAPGPARRAGRRPRGRRPADPAAATEARRRGSWCRSPSIRAECTRGRWSSRPSASAQTQVARGLRMAVRAQRRAAAAARRPRHHDEGRRGRRVRHRRCPTGSARPAIEPVELLSLLSRPGERIHVRAAPRRKSAR